jgi:hemerythrin-like domain-containing protein
MSESYAKRNGEGKHVISDADPQAIALLKEEHHRFRELFDAAESSEGGERKRIADELCLRLAVHMTIEEELLYPALKPVIGADEVNEGIVEHGSGKALMAEIEQLGGDEELYPAKVHVLGEETIHHIDEEDEELFEDARQAHEAGKLDLDALGEQMRARQAELYREVEETGEIGQTDEAEVEEIPSA